jgi:hypothetical protein
VFSWALLRALDQLGPRATYRELLTAARRAVEDKVRWQAPQLAGDEPADQSFLGGALRRPASGITMRHLRDDWEIDAGACHGIPVGPARLAVAGDFVGAGLVGAAFHGRPVRFRLPDDAPMMPGGHIRDWLKLIVAEDEFGSRPFEQEGLGAPDQRGALPRIAVTRNAETADPDDPYDWTATTVGVRTEVPG